MNEQNLTGKVVNYSEQKTGTGKRGNWAQMVVTLNENDKFSIMADSVNKLNMFMSKAPIGSDIAVQCSVNGQYYNYVEGSLRVLNKTDKPVAVSNSSYNDHWNKKTELDVNREERIAKNEPMHLFANICVGVLSAVNIDIDDVDKLQKRMETVISMADDIYIASGNKKVEQAKRNSQSEEVNIAQDNNII